MGFLADLERKAEDYMDADAQYFFVTDDKKRLAELLALRSLLLAERSTPVE